MQVNRCNSCGTQFLVTRIACPDCSGSDMTRIDVNGGNVIESVELIATPEPFPDRYSIVYFEADGGVRGFCRSEEKLAPGDRISISEDANGPVCRKS